jgi:hypothetical protein
MQPLMPKYINNRASLFPYLLGMLSATMCDAHGGKAKFEIGHYECS